MTVNIDRVDESIFDWSDSERSHSYYDLTRDAEQLMKGNEDICQRSFSQIRHWPPGGDSDEEDRYTKSALRRKSKKDISSKRNSVSWSSKVTCKTYSKDDPNNNDSFNANVSTSEGLNFKSHFDPLYDPHAQNEARVHKEKPPDFGPAPSSIINTTPNDPNRFNHLPINTSTNSNIQNNHHTKKTQQNQPPPNQYFDQYYGAGLDHENQPPDLMYGDSQNQHVSLGDNASWNGSDSSGGSQDQSGLAGSASGGSASGGSTSGGSASGDTYSDDSPYESTGSYFSNRLGGPHPNNNTEFVDEYGSESDSSSSGSNHNPDDQEEHYEDAVYDDWGDGKGQGNGSFSTGSSTSTTGRLPPVT